MNKKQSQLAARRQQLVAKAAAQRVALAHDMAPWRMRLALVDRGVAGIRYIRRHPVLMMGAAFIIAALRFQHTGKWLQRGLLIWQLRNRLSKHGVLRKPNDNTPSH